ncbi:hypothetical protein CBS101457_003395 [Exobasidium rhododendri]|nr:hypothetical protein CBS101457_003395 [Exobasidium rhododendri]
MVAPISLLLLAGAVAAAPFSLPNGFPNPSASALKQISLEAGGTLPNTALPTTLKADAIQSLQVIATNEIFETAFFSSLLDNVTNSVQGYTDFGSFDKSYVVQSLTAIRAQEELHAIGANAILASAGAKTIGACDYMFPVTNFTSAIALAATFTDLVLGTLQSVQQTFALDGGEAAQGLVSLVSSIVAQEGEQDGAYRLIQKKVPSASPFLTAASGAFAFNAVDQLFIVPNSCAASSNVSTIGIPAFDTLSLDASNAAPAGKNTTLKFDTSYTNVSATANHIVYISGQNAPVVRPITSVSTSGKMATFEAHFPFGAGFSNGLTVAALVTSEGPFASAAAVANATVAGPGLIEID